MTAAERTRRIESPRFGMVVTNGVAGVVWMLIASTYPGSRGDDRLQWDAVALSPTADIGRFGASAVMGRVFLAPGEFAEVVDRDTEYEFVGGPADGKRLQTRGEYRWMVADLPDISAVFDEDPLSEPTIRAVAYELRADGRYHVEGK